MRSLTLRLTVAFLVVGLTGSLLVAAFVGPLTRRMFDAFIVEQYETQVVATARDLYELNGSWDALRRLPPGRRLGPGGGGGVLPPMVLYDEKGEVVYGTSASSHPKLTPAAGTGQTAETLPIDVDGETVGFVQIVEAPGPAMLRGTLETRFLDGVDRMVRLSAVIAAALALVIGAILAGTISRPVRELTEATKAVAGGKLGLAVPVRTKDEIGELAASFNMMSADLARADRSRRQMTADIAHDLRTPLSVILGYSEALAEGKLAGSPEAYEAMRVQAEQLNRLIEDLRLLSLADAGQIALNLRLVDPRALLEHILLAYLTAAEIRSISLQVNSGETRPVLLDPERILQVLGNLVSNALAHTPDGGSIVLSSESEGEVTIFRIQDSGPGIPAEDLPHIFERFYRGDKTRHTPGASGLGLAIAKSLVESHGGDISAENLAGNGALITVRLPRSHIDSNS